MGWHGISHYARDGRQRIFCEDADSPYVGNPDYTSRHREGQFCLDSKGNSPGYVGSEVAGYGCWDASFGFRSACSTQIFTSLSMDRRIGCNKSWGVGGDTVAINKPLMGIRLELPGPPPWSCVVWMPSAEGFDPLCVERLNQLVAHVVRSLTAIAPDQVNEMRISPPFWKL